MRNEFDAVGLIGRDLLARRTKRLVAELAERLQAGGRDVEEAKSVIKLVLSGAELEVGSDDKTQYLLFLGNREIDKLADLCAMHWDDLAAIAASNAAPNQGDSAPRRRKSAGKEAVPKEVRDATLRIFDGGKAADLALFGRMLADLPDKNIEAASQVAHAISTNRISMELDYYTAVDDLKPEDTAGADMIGTVGFNSACFYRYANVDMGQLKRNLQGDEELAQQTLEAFIRASVNAIPTGKQNSMAAHNPPSFVLAVVRRSSLWNLANAFLKPVAPYAGEDLALRSIKALDSYWGKLTRVYGADAIVGKSSVSLEEDGIDNLKASAVRSVDALVENVLAETRGGV